MSRVILLDHHKTAFEMFDAPDSQHPNLDVQLDINRSGATIALDYFKPQVWNTAGKYVPAYNNSKAQKSMSMHACTGGS